MSSVYFEASSKTQTDYAIFLVPNGKVFIQGLPYPKVVVLKC